MFFVAPIDPLLVANYALEPIRLLLHEGDQEAAEGLTVAQHSKQERERTTRQNVAPKNVGVKKTVESRGLSNPCTCITSLRTPDLLIDLLNRGTGGKLRSLGLCRDEKPLAGSLP